MEDEEHGENDEAEDENKSEHDTPMTVVLTVVFVMTATAIVLLPCPGPYTRYFLWFSCLITWTGVAVPHCLSIGKPRRKERSGLRNITRSTLMFRWQPRARKTTTTTPTRPRGQGKGHGLVPRQARTPLTASWTVACAVTLFAAKFRTRSF